MKWSDAAFEAGAMMDAMSQFCHKPCIAGSIRRQAPEVRDIEIVAVPCWTEREEADGLFDTRIVRTNLLHGWAINTPLVRWIKPGTSEIIDWPPKPEGRYWRGLTPQGMKLDLFLATPENFGLILLIRTGPAEFSRRLVTQREHGGLMPPGWVVQGGALRGPQGRVDTPTEQSVFDALGLEYLAPQERNNHAQIS